MYIVISPAKKLNASVDVVNGPTIPKLLEDSKELISAAKNKSIDDLKKLMKISDKLATLNFQRFQKFSTPFTEKNSGPAINTFAGDTYVGLNASTMTAEDVDYAQNHLGILSGLYGLLRPKDLMQAYRLEMGTSLQNPRGKNLYAFWGDKITMEINQHIKAQNHTALINLASNEYFSSINQGALRAKLITPVFKEERKGVLKIISFSAKRARGTMARYILDHRLKKFQELKEFNRDGYTFKEELSDQGNWVFVR
jgi:uncharacterized protein